MLPLAMFAAIAVSTSTTTDPVLAGLIEESLARRPDLARAGAIIRAQRERALRVRALPNPSVSIGIQNDGFTSIEIGRMETSFVSMMVTQTFPWPGKRDLRGEVAGFDVDEAELDLLRARLTTEADVRRAYLDLLLARGRLTLLDELAALWAQSEGIAKVRYEAGEGAQSDLLRAQLERARIDKRRWAIQAEERTSLQALNRLRAHPLDEPIATTVDLRSLEDPKHGDLGRDTADALARSPELAAANVAVTRSDRATALAEKNLYPDLAVSLGVMPRGELPPMWQANVGITIPIFGRNEPEERRARAEGDRGSAASIELALRERVAERNVAEKALLDTLQLFRRGLLVQSRATADSTLAQYRVGRVSFASVLEAIAGYIRDEDELLETIAGAQRIQIAKAEVSLAPIAIGGGREAMGASPMPGDGAIGATRARSAATDSTNTSNGTPSMGGM